MIGRPHPGCWDDDTGWYVHTCHEPSGRTCIGWDCDEPAGTPWGPFFCPACDVARLAEIGAELERIQAEAWRRAN